MRDKKYLDWIRTLICLTCRTPKDIEPHHIPKAHHGAMGMKCSDKRTIPLCRKCHNEYHNSGRWSFAFKHNLDYEHVIERLQSIYAERNSA